jgi:hypothetical protein
MHRNNQPNAFELTAEQLAPFWAREKAASKYTASVKRLLTAAFDNATVMASSVSGRTRTGRCSKLNEEKLDYLLTICELCFPINCTGKQIATTHAGCSTVSLRCVLLTSVESIATKRKGLLLHEKIDSFFAFLYVYMLFMLIFKFKSISSQTLRMSRRYDRLNSDLTIFAHNCHSTL